MNKLQLIVARDEDGQMTLSCPGVGFWRRAPRVGHVLTAGQVAGVLSTLGRDQELVVPKGVQGVLVEAATSRDDGAVAYGDALMVLGDAGVGLENTELAGPGASAHRDGVLVFCSNSSGRFYLRPAPDKPAFVSEGDVIEVGQTIFLLEVMKTFSRVAYGGEGLPDRAKVLRIVPTDGDDLEAGQVVLELEAAKD